MSRPILLLLYVLLSYASFSQQKSKTARADEKIYFPPRGEWQHQSASAHGFDSLKLQSAIQFAIQHESKQPRNMEISQALTFGKEPFGFGIGPFSDRGEPTGLIIHHGFIIAEWGQPNRVDMTHSVTKSFLSTVIGLAIDQQLIKSVSDTVAAYVPPIEEYDGSPVVKDPATIGQPQMLNPFSSDHNRTLTWDVMLRQTSDWEGTLWGKPEWADRPDADATKWMNRPRHAPGSTWEYNDVRVNALALAATSVWRKPLPEVLKSYIMDPIGASTTWRWYGYRNSWIVLDGEIVQSVSGGGHWGGGMFINAYDMARFGLLTLHKGNWNGKQLISSGWFDQARTPTAVQPSYGYMNFFLNTDRKYYPNAPASAYAHIGNGANIIYVDPDHDLVMVVRWIEASAMNEMIGKLMDAMK
jgi:CubicO group peptidase (beta-lactamase class C family)